MRKFNSKNLIVLAAVLVISAACCFNAYADEIVPEGQATTEGQEAFANQATTGQQAGANVQQAVLEEPTTTGPLSYYETEAYTEECDAALRQSLLDYAMQFCGCPYRWGGINPLTGADCSGFVMHCIKSIVGLELPHSSRSQSGYGRPVAYEELKPGDLVFYATGSRIDHVAIYAGNDLVVHAANERCGILVSSIWHRNPVYFARVFGK